MPGAIDPVPYDVWRHISNYLSENELHRVISVNRAFYNIALESIYGEVNWHHLDAGMVKSLFNLRNPAIAARVGKLNIRAWFLRFQFEEEHKREEPPRTPKVRFCGLALSLSVPKVKHNWQSKKKYIAREEIEQCKAQLQLGGSRATLDAMQLAVVNMANLSECILDTRWLPPIAQPFLYTLGHSLGRNLRKLVFQGSAVELDMLILSSNLTDLRELSLTLEFQTYPPGSAERNADQHFLVSRLAPFINRLSSSLSYLSLSTSLRLDYSSFFHTLDNFPRLHELTLRTGITHESLCDPSGLVQFLRNTSPQLIRVSLFPQFSKHDDGALLSFVAQMTNQLDVLSGLEALTISYCPDFEVVLSLVERSRDSIKSLDIQHHCLDFQQVKDLTTSLSPELTSLSVEVQVLSPAIFDLLHRHVPCLESLELVYKEISGTYLDDDGHQINPPADSDNITEWKFPPFTHLMSAGRYQDWTLRNVGVWANSVHEYVSIDEKEVMFSIAGAAPRVSMFRGKPLSTFSNRGMTPH